MDHVLLMGSGFLVVLAISQLCVPRRTPTNNLLCLLSLVCFVWLAHGIGFRLGMLDVYPHLNKLHVPFLALTGPLWYVYVRALLNGDGWTRADRPHLLPAMVCVVLSLPFFLQSVEFKQAYIEIDVDGPVSLLMYVATRVAEIATIVYLALALRDLRQAQARNASTQQQARRHSVMRVLTTIAIVAAVTRLFGSLAGNHTLSVFIPIAMILIAFVSFYCLSHRHPSLMTLGARASSAKPVTREEKERLESFSVRMRESGWHLDPNLKVQQLARRLEVPPHELSDLINRGSGGNFNKFVNTLRIEHAKQRLLENAELTMLEVAHASGFNSESAFYSHFTRIESEPPAAYRRRVRTSAETTERQTSTT